VAVADAALGPDAIERAAGGEVLQRGVVGLALGRGRRAVGEVGADDDVPSSGAAPVTPR
jgi:hypothetical protein